MYTIYILHSNLYIRPHTLYARYRIYLHRDEKNSSEFTRRVLKKNIKKRRKCIYFEHSKRKIYIILYLGTTRTYKCYLYIYIFPAHRLSNAETNVLFFFFGNCPVYANDLSVPDRCTVSRAIYIL